MPGAKILDFLRHKAVQDTAVHLESHAQEIANDWMSVLSENIPAYRCLPDKSSTIDGGIQAAFFISGLLRAENNLDEASQNALLFQLGIDSEKLRLGQGFALDDIVKGLSLFRQVVLSHIHQLLRRRFWFVIPSHFVKIEASINQAADLCILAVSQSYLKAREEIIREREQELELRNAQLVTLNQEMHHRIRNNLQMVADLLSLGMNQGFGKTPQECLRESFFRVKSISAVHDLLSVDHANTTDIKELSSSIANVALASMLDQHRTVTVSIQGSSLFLPSRQATALAIIINELMSNALEHGYKDRSGGSIQIVVGPVDDDNMVEVSVIDDGSGLPEGFNVEYSPNLGLDIVRTLVRNELDGELSFQSNHGTKATVRFCR